MARTTLVVILVLILVSARWIAGLAIEYQWWKEMRQVETWLQMLSYNLVPATLAALVAFAALWVAHARGMKHAGTGLRHHPVYAAISTVVLLLLGAFLAAATVDGWTIVRWAGSRGAPGGWQDPVFGHPLSFYFFDVPFYRVLLRFVLGTSLAAALVFWAAARFWELRSRTWFASEMGGPMEFDFGDLRGSFEARFLRAAAALFFVAWAVSILLGRYDLLFEDHGSLVGVDWTADNVSLPLAWLKSAAALAAAAAFLAGRFRWALVFPAVLIVGALLPPLFTALYVRPSEITIQRPYIERHIAATRAAYRLDRQAVETDFPAQLEAPIDRNKHRALFDNVRLWDWRAFHDTVTQIQALRPYYVFHDTDVDRYQIDGQLRQILVTPREIDVAQLPADARARWINPHFVYTHGYGMVAAEASRITSDGLPYLLIQDAPPVVRTKSLRLTRPEIYFGEVSHEPVFVHTKQPEFDYPSGSGNVETRYAGKGGFPISSMPLRVAAALRYGDWNIVLTSYLTPESRMIIRRKVRERLEALAEFILWDQDPYLVITRDGRLVWMVDGYTASASHPYSRALRISDAGVINYIRNSVKATVDAYDGEVRIYVFDEEDPILASYRRLFPKLFTPRSAMPADLRAHARYPETIFRIQAEIYRTYHMTDPEAFYNKEDVWDLARNLNSASGRPQPVTPTYIVAALPGSDTPEFLLMTTFTPRNKDNLIGLMVARCDGDALGELHFLQLSKQQLIFGPMQIEARINQDQIISKDLTLWNQQGSQVLRGQMLVLPVDNTLVYVEPIYIQAAEARMPQLKKVVVAMGNRLIYADTYEDALAQLTGQQAPPARPAEAPAAAPAAQPPAADESRKLLEEISRRLQRYRELMGQGRFADAGREIEAVERLAAGQKQP
ncbi:MAG: UPF0182 protein [Bryobacteraceae bacterium]|nr:MAG: UPF0182 protein [Bryobacteraceae bacterium]